MATPNVPTTNRKPSKLSMLGERIFSSKDTPRSSTPDSTRTSSVRGSFREKMHRLRESASRSSVKTASPSSPAPSTPAPRPLVISTLTKAFVDALNATQLSNFLTWMLYHDIVELADDPETWYKPIDGMDMRGWVALGDFLSKARQTNTGYGFDLIVLDAICDRTRISRVLVHELLIKFSDPDSMRYGTLAMTAQKALAQGCTQLEVLEAMEKKLRELMKLVLNLHPQPNSRYDEWHAMVQKRIRGFLDLVVRPRIAAFRSGNPVLTSTTNQIAPNEVHQGIQLNYFYEAMQEEREVPLKRYGIHAGSSDQATGDEEIERARQRTIHLIAENHKLRSTIADLEQDKAGLIQSNDKLAQKVGALGKGQPAEYHRLVSPSSSSYNASSATPPTRPAPAIPVPGEPKGQATQAPSHRRTPSLAPPLDNSIPKRHSSSASTIRNYDDVFSGFQDSSLPELSLVNPGLISASPSTTTTPEDSESVTVCGQERPLPARYRRRSGGFYDRQAVGYLAGVGERQREVFGGGEDEDGEDAGDEDEDEDEDEGREIPLVVPSPRGSRRFDLLE